MDDGATKNKRKKLLYKEIEELIEEWHDNELDIIHERSVQIEKDEVRAEKEYRRKLEKFKGLITDI